MITFTDEDVQPYYDQLHTAYEQQAQLAGIDLETMASYYGMDLASFEEELKLQAEEATKQDAVVRAIAAKENIPVTDEDREALATQYGYETVEAMDTAVGTDMVESYILTQKVLDLLAENAVAE